VGRMLRDFLYEFAKHPEHDLHNIRWDTYEAGKTVLLDDSDGYVKETYVDEIEVVYNSLNPLP
jgi:hypothetical protein